MIETVQQGLKAEGIQVSISKLCDWFPVPRRTFYYKSVKGQPRVQKHFETPIKAMIEENPSFCYRTVAYLLGFNKNVALAGIGRKLALICRKTSVSRHG
jgi:putative transposase